MFLRMDYNNPIRTRLTDEDLVSEMPRGILTNKKQLL
jgi:hypothetical protein